MKKKHKSPAGFSIAGTLLVLLILLLSGCGADLLNPTSTAPEPTAIPTSTPAPTVEEVVLPTTESIEEVPTPIPTLPSAMETGTLPGLIVYAMSEAGYSHLIAWHPETMAPTRLTYGDWDDVHPDLSPDGQHLAFSSNRHGYWDIFILDLTTGITTQLTDDKAYEGHPDWSSDGIWLAYEKYMDGNLDIYIRPFAADLPETRVTTHTAPDFQPAWQPGSDLIAFSSMRGGAADIYLVNAHEYSAPANYTINFITDQRGAVWPPDGGQLGWISRGEGYPAFTLVESSQQAALADTVVTSVESIWDPTGAYLLSLQTTPDDAYLAIQQMADLRYLVLPNPISGQVHGIDWGINALCLPLPDAIRQAAVANPSAPWLEQLIPSAGALSGRQQVVDIPGIKAPTPALAGMAVEPFFALKDRANRELGWDVLSDLDNMFVSITETLPPNRQSDWLFTGRAFALNPVLIDYEYMLVVKEEFGTDTYWRIFLKPLDQSGLAGAPLTQIPWDFNARFNGSPTAYENGGETYLEIPGGYWVDFTTLALDYGWERSPALLTWNSYIQGARYNTFAITSGLDWEDAMIQIWPPEIFLGGN